MLDLFQKDGKIGGGFYTTVAFCTLAAMVALSFILMRHLSLTFHIADMAGQGVFPSSDTDGYYDPPAFTAWQQRLFDENLSLSTLNLVILAGTLVATLNVYYKAHVTRLNAMGQPRGLALLCLVPFVFALGFCGFAIAAHLALQNAALSSAFSILSFFCAALTIGAAGVMVSFLGFGHP